MAWARTAAILAAAGILVPPWWPQHAHGPGAPHWSYTGATGPAHWGDLSPDYAACKRGREQSPIDIAGPMSETSEPIEFKYGSAPLHIINNGHSIQIDYTQGSKIVVDETDYALVQLHFHHPSEERIHGQAFAMDAHLVHRDPHGHLAVVAIEMIVGRDNAFLASLGPHLPTRPGGEQAPAGVSVDAASLLPPSLGYYRFAGSLTTPPCSEGVRWFVLSTPVEMSPAQLAEFARLYPNNARPLQPANGRTIEENLPAPRM